MKRLILCLGIIAAAALSGLIWSKANVNAEEKNKVYEKMAVTYDKLCATCHGDKGAGGYGPSHINCRICGSSKSLYNKINNEMPLGNSSLCVDDCARDMAAYIHDVLNGNQQK